MQPISAVFIQRLNDLDAEYLVFFNPIYGGGHVVNANMEIMIMDFEMLKVPMFETAQEAFEFAELQAFGPQPE